MPNSNVDKAASPRLTLIATSLGFVLIILDVTVVNVALERIKSSLETDVTGLQWVMNAYTLVFASLLLTAGALGDRFGAKRIFIGGFAMFTVASLVCGLAGSITVLIAGRIAQGVGAALCVPASLALVSASFPDAAARARAVSIWAGVGVFGSLVAGPGRLLGGIHWAMLLAGVALVIGCLVSILGMGPRPFSLRQFSLRQTASGRKAS